MLKKVLTGLTKKSHLTNKNLYKFSSPIFLKGGCVVNSDEMFRADVLIEKGKIVQVGEHILPPSDAKIIDAHNKLIMPGGIDTHTHMQLPFMGTVAVDDFDLGTRAAVSGGTTSILDFVIPAPGASLIEAYDKWMGWAKDSVNCNFGFHAAVTSWNSNTPEELEEVVNRGVQSFKVFLAYKGALMLGSEGLINVMEKAKELGAIVMAHCEDGELVYRNQQHLLKLGITGPEGHVMSRDQEVEGLGTRTMITVADQIGSPVYIVHVQSKCAGDEVARARKLGFQTFGETLCTGFTCDGNMVFDKDWKKAATYVMSPPISTDTTTHDYLLNNLQCGNLQTIATDNCTFCSQTKYDLGSKQFTTIPNGCNGIEDRMNVTWTKAVNSGYFSPMDFVRLTSTNAAQIFNLYPRKGVIRPGSDADVIVFDPEAEKIISAKTHNQAVDTNVFEGMQLKGVTTSTIMNGDLVYHEGILNTQKGSGQYLARQPFGYPFARTFALNSRRDPLKKKVDRSGAPEPEAPSAEELQKLQKQVDLLASENKQLKEKMGSRQ